MMQQCKAQLVRYSSLVRVNLRQEVKFMSPINFQGPYTNLPMLVMANIKACLARLEQLDSMLRNYFVDL